METFHVSGLSSKIIATDQGDLAEMIRGIMVQNTQPRQPRISVTECPGRIWQDPRSAKFSGEVAPLYASCERLWSSSERNKKEDLELWEHPISTFTGVGWQFFCRNAAGKSNIYEVVNTCSWTNPSKAPVVSQVHALFGAFAQRSTRGQLIH